jgi:hypothetical protein
MYTCTVLQLILKLDLSIRLGATLPPRSKAWKAHAISKMALRARNRFAHQHSWHGGETTCGSEIHRAVSCSHNEYGGPSKLVTSPAFREQGAGPVARIVPRPQTNPAHHSSQWLIPRMGVPVCAPDHENENEAWKAHLDSRQTAVPSDRPSLIKASPFFHDAQW